jgi:hypothetical protein
MPTPERPGPSRPVFSVQPRVLRDARMRSPVTACKAPAHPAGYPLNLYFSSAELADATSSYEGTNR